MTLREWVSARGRGELSRLSRETGLAYTTVFGISRGKPARYASAKAISDATGGAVTVAELCEAAAATPKSA